jgi:membrane protease YdiL (CAAX protease family)
MSTITRAFRTYPVAWFTGVACILGWIFYILGWLGVNVGTPSNMPLGVVVAAAVVAAVMGRSALREWGRLLLALRASLGWYLLAIAAPVIIIVVIVLLNHALGAPLPTSAQLSHWTELPLTLVFMLVFVGVGEEAGWTAFAAPRLLSSHPFMTAWVILSAIRVFWHLPLMLTGQLSWVLGIVGNIAFQFLLLWVFLRTGVWFLAGIWHAVLNTVSGSFFFQMVQGPDQARLGVLMSAAYLLLAIAVYFADRSRLTRAQVALPVRS